MRNRHRLVAAFAALALCACAAHETVPSAPDVAPEFDARLREARDLVTRGSYSCLREAHGILGPLHAQSPDRPDVRDTLLEVDLLLAMREKQLAIVGEEHLAAAEQLMAASGPSPRHEAMAAVARGAMPGDTGVIDDDTGMSMPRADVEEAQRLAGPLARAARSDPVAAAFVLAPSLWMLWPGAELPSAEELAATHRESALVAIALGFVSHDDARRAIELEPTAHEARLVLGRSLRGREPSRAEDLLRAAFEGLPDSIVAAHSLAGLLFGLEDYARSLEVYERVLALAPNHRDAWLRKGIVLNLLGRPEESEQALEHLVALGNWYLGEARYWLARNRRDLGDPERAEDLALLAARWLPGDPRVHALAARVALDRGAVDLAQERFGRAVSAAAELPSEWDGDDDVCNSHASLGVIASEREAWADARAHFESASRCRDTGRMRAEAEIERIGAWTPPTARSRALAASRRRMLERVLEQRAGNLYNAAVCAGHAGERLAARELARRAGEHEAYAEKSQELIWQLQ